MVTGQKESGPLARGDRASRAITARRRARRSPTAAGPAAFHSYALRAEARFCIHVIRAYNPPTTTAKPMR